MFLAGVGGHEMAAFLAILATPVSAFWRLPCSAPLVVQRADPIISPGKPSGHVHTIMGGNGFGFAMDYDDTQAGTCSSCQVTQDMSNYWVPTLYYMAKNGSFIDVPQNGGGTIYYLQREDPKDPEYSSGLLAFPEGFRMVAGNPSLRNYTDVQAQQAISYACLGVDGPETNYFPKQPCPNGIRAQVFFPSCWDGVNLDSTDHKSHVSYPSMYNDGFCPPTYPKRFISLFYEVTWVTSSFDNQWYDGHQPFVWSHGDDTGYGYHGDFINGWDVPTLQQAVTQCTDPSGVIQLCPVFKFFEDSVNDGCKIPPTIDETITGQLDALPGCNPVQSGPEMAQSATGCGAPTTIGTPQYTFTDLTVSKGFEYVGCGIDAIAGQPRTLADDSLVEPGMTVEKCVDYCVSKGFSMAGVEYSQECYCSNTLPADRAPDPKLMGNCVMPCSGDSKEMCGGQGAISLYQKCGSSCQNYLFSDFNKKTVASGGPSSVSPASSSIGTGGYYALSSGGNLSAPVIRPTTTPTTVNSPGQVTSSSMSQGGNGDATITIPVATNIATASNVGTSTGESIRTVTETVTVCSCPTLSPISLMAISSEPSASPPTTSDTVPTPTQSAISSSSGDSDSSASSHTSRHRHAHAHFTVRYGN